MRILIIDDDHDFADGLAELLDVFGHAAQATYSSQEGLAAADRETFDLTLIDVGLAGKNGADCAREMAQRKKGARCILMTGYGADALEKMGVSTEDFTTLRKPLKPEDLAPYLS